MRTRTKLAAAFLLVNLAAAIHAARSGRPRGSLLGMPYDFSLPTPGRARDRLWSRDAKIVTPPVFGAGWSLNLREIGRRLGLVADEDRGDEEEPDS